MDSTQLLINELTQRIAQAQIEAAGWKVRASIAEASLAELEETLADEDLGASHPEGDEIVEDLLESYGGSE
jgi:hypothetical protein